MMRAHRFAAMGTTCHLIVVGGDDDLPRIGQDRIDQLEARWSRFRPDSELSRINAAAGRPVRVSDDTMLAVSAAVTAWKRLDGAYDPTVLNALEAAGYDRTFAAIDASSAARRGHPDGGHRIPRRPTPGCAGISIDPVVQAIQVPTGTRIDLGGIGKGLAADLTANLLIRSGADTVLVNIGGDLRVAGECPNPGGWTVGLDALPGRSVRLESGGLATSAITKRRWRRHGRDEHHVIDPHTGRPATACAALATAVAVCAATAETLATAALLAGPDDGVALLAAHHASGVVIGRDGTARSTADLLPLVV